MAHKAVRLAVVAQFPIHYHLPLYRAMTADPHIEADILFMQRAWSESGFDPEIGGKVAWGAPLFEGYPHKIFKNISPARNGEGFWKFINPGLIWRVLTGPYDAVYIHGHNHFTHIACMIAARLGGKRLILRNIAYNLGARPALKRLARRFAYGLLYRLPQVCLYIGTHNRAYYRDFGVADDRLVYVPHIVDNDHFTAQADRLQGQQAHIKAGFAMEPNQGVILYAAKFLAKKQPLRLIEAFVAAKLGDNWTLLMVGDGPLRRDSEALAARYTDKRIIFAGFLDQQEIGRAYAIADMVVLPSAFLETWGLVVNEALNFGCPMIVSDRVGCAPDLVAGQCGLVVPHDDTNALTDALTRLASDDDLRQEFRGRATAVIKGWNSDAYMAGLRAALGITPASP